MVLRFIVKLKQHINAAGTKSIRAVLSPEPIFVSIRVHWWLKILLWCTTRKAAASKGMGLTDPETGKPPLGHSEGSEGFSSAVSKPVAFIPGSDGRIIREKPPTLRTR